MPKMGQREWINIPFGRILWRQRFGNTTQSTMDNILEHIRARYPV
jgi:hypothetical protein